jgi:hypothetical protein
MSREREDHPIGTADIAHAAEQQHAQPAQPSVPPMPRNEMDGGGRDERLAPLFDRQLADDMRRHWGEVQSGFVDDPRRAVQQADELVAKALQDLARSFAHHREQIEKEAAGGEQQPSTEGLRIALQRYRSFFERLLNL